MTTGELNTVADTLCTVYRRRGFILVEDVQAKLDMFGASLVETTQLLRLLEERGCRVSEQGDTEDDISMYDESDSESSISPRNVEKLRVFYKNDLKAGISELSYNLVEYSNGLLYYAYLRLQLGLSRQAASQSIITLQETYDMYLPAGEDKAVFDIISAAHIQTVMETIHNRKVYKKIRAVHKNALGTYQMFLTQNRHRIIAACEANLSSKVKD